MDNNAAATTAVFSTLAMHGTGHRLEKWAEDTTRLTLLHPMAIEGCRVLSRVVQLSSQAKGEPLEPDAVISAALEGISEPALASKLEALPGHLAAGHTPDKVADQFGWKHRIDSSMLPTTVMGLYCWMRSPKDFEGSVLPAIGLGGDTSSLGGLVGSLVGAYAGFDAIPSDLYRNLGGLPHGPEWLTALGERFSRWPHGEHDLHMAPAQVSDPPMQIIRNLYTLARLAANRIGRWPRRALGDRKRQDTVATD